MEQSSYVTSTPTASPACTGSGSARSWTAWCQLLVGFLGRALETHPRCQGHVEPEHDAMAPAVVGDAELALHSGGRQVVEVKVDIDDGRRLAGIAFHEHCCDPRRCRNQRSARRQEVFAGVAQVANRASPNKPQPNLSETIRPTRPPISSASMASDRL